ISVHNRLKITRWPPCSRPPRPRSRSTAAVLERAVHILADADERDHHAEARDAAATTRDTEASLRSFLRDSADEYGPALKARRSAAIDRTDSKTDRTSAAADRSELASDESTSPEVDND
ncbi:hypothetical protein ACWKSP_41070, partial [Micromonosporaceae bacterium Da 78-11]